MIVDIYSYESLNQLDKDFKEMLEEKDGSNLNETSSLIQDALLLEQYVINLFPISQQMNEIMRQAKLSQKLSDFKTRFMQKRVMRKYKKDEVSGDFKDNFFNSMSLNSFVDYVIDMLDSDYTNEDELEKAIKFASYKMYFEPDHNIFKMPKQIDFENLVGLDKKYEKKEGLAEAHYCIYCHNQEKDFCRTGMKEKTNPIKNNLNGCPLGQKISEMNYLYAKGHIIAALAITMIDNPLVAATGHRVCNDCMKSCIFQKQEPVDIPCIESDMLQDVLKLPYGAEIYYLFTRWNPLDNFVANPGSENKALIAGLGPSGFALSYYLLREGNEVLAIDAMDIKPLPDQFFEPIANWKKLAGQYSPQGFGGVSEYGITDRWDKNNLMLIRMILERFEGFQILGKTKLGKDLKLEDACQFYDHTALCLGAGSPILPDVQNIDADGIYSPFTFLLKANMGEELPQPLQMPAIVLGAGLTGIDCAVEAKNLYIRNISDFASSGKTPSNDLEKEYLKHYNMIQNGDFSFLDISILYRKTIQESPSYRENHDELQVSLDEGIKFVENTSLKNIQLDTNGRIESINDSAIKAKSMIYAYSTHENDKLIKSDAFKKYKDKISVLGDLDPKYAGTVVKAIASAKDIYTRVSNSM